MKCNECVTAAFCVRIWVFAFFFMVTLIFITGPCTPWYGTFTVYPSKDCMNRNGVAFRVPGMVRDAELHINRPQVQSLQFLY